MQQFPQVSQYHVVSVMSNSVVDYKYIGGSLYYHRWRCAVDGLRRRLHVVKARSRRRRRRRRATVTIDNGVQQRPDLRQFTQYRIEPVTLIVEQLFVFADVVMYVVKLFLALQRRLKKRSDGRQIGDGLIDNVAICLQV
jgi:hypothetical protein